MLGDIHKTTGTICKATIKCPIDDQHLTPEEYESYLEGEYGLIAQVSENEDYWVEDAGGDGMFLKPGEFNEEVKSLFRQGQCLALATQLSKRFGNNKLFAIYKEQEGEEYLWDDETNDYVYDEDGSEVIATEEVIHHFYAVDESGNTWDVDGVAGEITKVSDFYIEKDFKTVSGTVEELSSRFGGWMTDQNYEFAETVIDEIL